MPDSDAAVGSVVRFRHRDWIVIPSTAPNAVALKPLSGSSLQTVHVPRVFIEAGLERVEPTAFPAPNPATTPLGDYDSAQLVFQSARFLLRNAAVPLRSFGNISTSPRPYQLVPLILALRSDVVRMLICDDVGLGKTIEALLIARELLDRGEIHRIAVVCPPHLCDQWAREMNSKFSLDTWSITSSTTLALERSLPPDRNVFQAAPHFVTSADFVKLPGKTHDLFSRALPGVDLVIIDEAHACAKPAANADKLRYQLAREIADDPKKHLLLLTATPHPGESEAYRSLLAMLSEELEPLDPMNREHQKAIAAYVIQRTREDVRDQGESSFPPPRETEYLDYALSPEHKELVARATELCRPILDRAASSRDERLRFYCYYAVFSILRCIASSPRAAAVCLGKKAESPAGEDPNPETISRAAEPHVTDTPDAEFSDELPESTLADLRRELKRRTADLEPFRAIAAEFEKMCGPTDRKLNRLRTQVEELLAQDHAPVIWCRYLATAAYVYERLKGLESASCAVALVTGADPESVREEKIDALRGKDRRILVATDCISEGVNLQEILNAVIHYDIPLNPNRLEQRAGRVDRFGQTRQVRELIMYSKDNPLEDRIFEILVQKVVTIKKETGIVIPIAGRSEAVHKHFLNQVFNKLKQLTLFPEENEVSEFFNNYPRFADRAAQVRRVFKHESAPLAAIQDSIKACDAVLGTAADLKFLLRAGGSRLGIPIEPFTRAGEECFRIPNLTPELAQLLGSNADEFRFTTSSPSKTSYPYVGRLHPLVSHMAERLFERAVATEMPEPVPRCAVLAQKGATAPTAYFLLRARYLLKGGTESLAEELIAVRIGEAGDSAIAEKDEAMGREASSSLDEDEKRSWLARARQWHEKGADRVRALLKARLKEFLAEHKKVRRALGHVADLAAEPASPPYDILGIIVLVP